MPAALKGSLFTEKTVPDLLAEYDVLGFDADHCIVKYHLPNLTRLLCKITANDLVELYGYPEQIKEISDSLHGIALNNVVWDIEHRTLLKLGEGKIVVQAFRGTQRLQISDIEDLYGSPPIFRPLDYPATRMQSKTLEGAYWTMMTYFDCCKSPVIARGLDLIQQGVITGKSDLDFAHDIQRSCLRQYVHYTNDQYNPIGTYGDFFPAVI